MKVVEVDCGSVTVATNSTTSVSKSLPSVSGCSATNLVSVAWSHPGLVSASPMIYNGVIYVNLHNYAGNSTSEGVIAYVLYLPV